jgi:membrane protease subunit HflK
MAWGDNTKDKDNKKSPWGAASGKKKPTETSSEKPKSNDEGIFGGAFGGDNKTAWNPFDALIDTIKEVLGLGDGKNNGKKSGDNQPPEFNSKSISFISGVILLVWLSTGFYTVGPEEEGIELTFGKYSNTSTSGLRYHLPYPIQEVIKVPVTKINSVEVGFRSSITRSKNQNSGEAKVEEESLMITGDTNIADVAFEVQWRITDAKKFLFNIRDPEQTVKSVSESAMREVIGRTPFATALSEGRQFIAEDAKRVMQSTLDSYDAGIQVVLLQLRPVQNPGPVMDAFLDVETAKQDRETAINRARTYVNDIIPRARGDAEKILQDAEAYKQQVIANAKGEAQRFSSVYEEYKLAKDVTRKRIYVDTMQQVLTGMNKTIIDSGTSKSGVVPYLPLQEFKKPEPKKEN